MNLRYNLYLKKEKLKRFVKRRQNGSCTVLLYHRVRETNFDKQQLSVSPINFQAQIKHLKKKYHFITVEEFDHCLLNGLKFEKNSLLVSFDDGYADNYYEALPVLEAEKVQAIFYIATKNLNTSSIFWWDELDEIFKNPDKLNAPAVNSLLKIKSLTKVDELYHHYLLHLKTASGITERNQLLEEVRTLNDAPPLVADQHRVLTHNELVKLMQSAFSVIGAHTVNHLSLAHLSATDQEFEITTSANELSNITGNKVLHFSFPYGEKHNYNEHTLQLCKQAGFTHSAANYGGYVDRESDPFSFPRFVVRNDVPQVLEQKLKTIL
ncbi:MAG: polysaccharide deacetylase family protein [Bacteroidia bacterium]|nr:polysaccharide deacetylase family protein [Bacteroidia bacterium]